MCNIECFFKTKYNFFFRTKYNFFFNENGIIKHSTLKISLFLALLNSAGNVLLGLFYQMLILFLKETMHVPCAQTIAAPAFILLQTAVGSPAVMKQPSQGPDSALE